ncbi:MAG: DUF460 domain-containing protein [Methanosarcinales archaeon]|nr:DUF460 domain-containing protein [Methanosarcinales archaeon]
MLGLIFGVDIASGSARSRHPSYALAILDGEQATAFNMISRHKLIRLIREQRPELIAVDNVHELASSRRDLISLLRQLPMNTRLVQVTGGERQEALTRVARWHGMTFDRLNPMEEAEACARLAAKGVGQVVCAFEDRTWIKVSRRRSPGRGGWSQKRYSRKIHGTVKGRAREVEKQLRESGFSFTSRAVEGLGGYIRCEFVVEAPRERVPVKPGCYEDAQVRVEGVERPRLQFLPLQQRRGYIIAGIDPGTTTGVAALNLQGELVDVTSARAMSPADVIEWIAARGKPLIVATDVFPTPGAVEKIKRSFNSVLYSPGEAVPAEDKIAMARQFGYKNDHQRDALAAAVSAFKKYRNKFSLVEKKAPPEIDPDEVKALVVRGYSIENAIAELVAAPAPERPEQAAEAEGPADVVQVKDHNRQLEEQIKTLRDYQEELKSDLARKDQEVAGLLRKLERVRDQAYRETRRDHEIRIRDKEIERLRGLLRAERKILRRLKSQRSRLNRTERVEELKGYRRLKPVEAFSKEAVVSAGERWSIGRGDLVLLGDASGGGPHTADLLVKMGVEAVVSEGEMPREAEEYLHGKGVPVLMARDLELSRIDGIAFVDPENLERVRAAWAEQMERQSKEKKTRWLESMIQEYRVSRKKEEKKQSRPQS